MLKLPVLQRPRSRGGCEDVPRPCPYVGCRHHLLLDVEPDGSIEVAARRGPQALAPDQEAPPGWMDEVLERLFAMEQSCALDVADAEDVRRQDGIANYADVGAIIGCGRERVRQICDAAVETIRAACGDDE